MPYYRKTKVIIICEKCGHKPEKDTQKSEHGWDVYNTKDPCPECGGKLTIKVE